MKRIILFIAALIILQGCGGRAVLKTENPVPAATPVVNVGPQVPSLVEVRVPVADADYQQSLAAVGTSEVSRRNIEDYLAVAQYEYNHADLFGSLKTYQKILLGPSQSPLDKAQYMVGQIYYDKKDYLPSLSAFQKVVEKYPKSNYSNQALQMMEFILTYALSLEDLKSFTVNYPDSPLHCSALFQMGSREAQTGMASEAAEHLNQFLQQCPDHPSVAAAQMLAKSLQSQAQGKTWKIAVLAPITGRYKNYGIPVVNGVKLALEQANQAGGSKRPTVILIRDTGSDPVRAVQAFEELAKDDSLDALIGPVAPSEIAAVAPLANLKKITLISPASSRDGISGLGPYLFSNSMTREMEGRAMGRYAVEHLGFKRFGILAPDDDYGQNLSDAFTKTVESMGATVQASQVYVPNVTDFQKQIIALGGQNPETAKEGERENNRKMDELKYALGKEVGKILLKAKEMPVSVEAAETPAVAFVPLVEALTNTPCPSIVKAVNDSLLDSLKAQTDYNLRNQDLIQQALTRLPVEYKGTTLEVTADKWDEVAEDLQASLIVTGQVVETNPPGDWSDHPTWDFILNFQAYQMNPKKNNFVKIYQGKLLFSSLKPASLIRVNSDFQALYLPVHTPEIPLLAAQIHFYDLNPVFLGDHNWESDTVIQEGAKDVEGSYYLSGFYVDSQQGTAKKFAEDYLRKFSVRPDFLAAQSFDAAKLLLQATAASTSREDIHNQLLMIKDFDGVSGKTSFAGHGEADKMVPVLKIQDGKLQQVQ